MDCIVCNSNNWFPSSDLLVRCSNCTLVRAKDDYFSTNLSQLYGPKYFNGIDYADYQLEKTALLNNFTNRLKKILHFQDSGKLLEIGCAYGYFLEVAQKYFKCTGIDLNPQVTNITKKNVTNSTILTGDLLQKKLKKTSFNVVCLFDTIEHLISPEKYLKKAYSLLKPGGIIAIETGDIESTLARTQKQKWRLITPPTHLYYFSKTTLSNLVKNAGFQTLKVEYPSFHRTLYQTIFRLTKNHQTCKSLHHLLLKFRSILTLTYPLNTKDIIFLIAQKPVTGY